MRPCVTASLGECGGYGIGGGNVLEEEWRCGLKSLHVTVKVNEKAMG